MLQFYPIPFLYALLLAVKGKRQVAMPALVSDLNSNQYMYVSKDMKVKGYILQFAASYEKAEL